IVEGTLIDDDVLTIVFAPPDDGSLAVFARMDAAGAFALGQPHGDAPVDGDEDGGLSGFDDGVLAGDEQLAGGPGLDHARLPSPAAVVAASAGGTSSSAVSRWAPGPGPTTRTSPKPESFSASASASRGRTMTATFGPASAVE